MKKILVLLLVCFSGLVVNAQKGNDAKIDDKVQALNKAIFVQKDSLALENLLGKEIIYGHSGGKVETRQEMIKNVLANASYYSDVKTEITNIVSEKKFIVVRHIITATENLKDGKTSPLKLGVVQTWVKEGKDWKLVGRQAVKLPLQ
jgi:hypothetical protein